MSSTDRAITERMIEEFEDLLYMGEFEKICEQCPLVERCGKEQLFYGCGVWEEEMEEDL